MSSSVLLAKSKGRRLVWITVIVGLLLGLSAGAIVKVASASNNKLSTEEGFAGPALQVTPTPTAAAPIESTSVFSVTLAELGYDEITLNSPYDQFQYSFRLPENWVIEADGTLVLDLSYTYFQSTEGEYPLFFGELVARFDSQTLETLPVSGEELDEFQWRVQLPASALNDPDQSRHTLDLIFNAPHLCDVPHEARLVVHPTSSLSLTYSQEPLVLDLANYPRPFYQPVSGLDRVRFVLPSQPTAGDLSNAASVAAKLGDLTGGGVVISATTDLELSDLIESAQVFDEHFVVIGPPQHNQLLPLLNEATDLPVSLHQRQLDLSAAGPAAVVPGETFTYSFVVTNTLDQTLNLSVIDALPPYTELITCSPTCTENEDDGSVAWTDNQLAPDETLDFLLTLGASDVLTGTMLENVVTLVEDDLGPVNAATLTSAVVAEAPDAEAQVLASGEGDYLFVYQGKAVAESDGVVQEVLSPWNDNQAILIITGLNDEAVRKANLAMSSEARFPGIGGQVALVREAQPSASADGAAPAVVDITLADLGYSDQLVYGGGTIKQVDYYFQLPYGWQLTEDAFIELDFTHSELIDYQDSGLTVLLNGQPLASIALNEQSASDGRSRVSLAYANVRPGSNRLTLEADVVMPGVCVEHEQAWLNIENSSKIFLAHLEDTELSLDLDLYPYPFHMSPDLSDLLLVLPAAPAVDEWEMALRLAASLGASAGGGTMVPTVAMDSDLPSQDLEGYQVIALGRPTRNATIQQVNADLPQSFMPGTDDIDQRLDAVVFRLPPGVDLGFLQLISSPWSEAHAFLAVTGTTDRSVNRAASVLIDRPWAMTNGNLAMVRDDEVATIKTVGRTGSGMVMRAATSVPETASTAAPSPASTPMPAAASPATTPGVSDAGQKSAGSKLPAWLIVLVVMTGVVVVASFGIALWQARRSKQ